MTIDRDLFFNDIRHAIFGGHLDARQVEGVNAILDGWETRHGGKDLRWLAYGLATAHHETAATMQPIDERGSVAYFERMYGIAGRNPARARAMGNDQAGDGARYHGRGLVQLTWKANYRVASAFLSGVFGRSIDLVANPDLAKEPDLAVEILIGGMERGLFTGKRFQDFFADRPARIEWIAARSIINGRDRAAPIAARAKAFHRALGPGKAGPADADDAASGRAIQRTIVAK